MKVAPSIIAAKFSEFQQEVKRVEQAGADLLHLDVMDGVFVPNLTFGPMVVKAMSEITKLELDAHLMIVKPENYLRQFIEAGLSWVSFHAEATDKPEHCIEYVQRQKVNVGLAINPRTAFSDVRHFIDRLDYLLIMTVNPGFYGQEFMGEVLPKIEEAKDFVVKHGMSCKIEVDGGINSVNAEQVCNAGADIIVAGAGIFKAADYAKAIEDLRCLKG